MDGLPTVSRQDLQCLEALYDVAGTPAVDALSVLEATGLDTAQAQRWLLDARARNLVSEVDASLVPADEPTAVGREIVETARRRRTNRSYLRRTAQDRLLAWADDTGGGNVTGFLSSDYAWVDGLVLDLTQAAEAAAALHSDGLVKANMTRAWGADVVRADVTILSAGRSVIDEFNGDVASWRASRARSTASVNIEHNSGAIAFGGDGASVHAAVTAGVDPEGLRQLVEALRAAHQALVLGDEDMREYDANLRELQVDDPGRVRRALRWFGRLGTDIGTNALGGMLGAQALALLGT